jgi:hypothetical protein
MIDTNERNKRPNVVRKSGRLQAEKQLIDSSIEVNQNNHNINEECDQFVRGMNFLFAQFLLGNRIRIKCVFGCAVVRTESYRIDFERIDFSLK